MTKNAVIFSKNEKLYAFIQNELLLLDYNVTPTDLTYTAPDVIVFDTTSLDLSPDIRTLIATSSSSLKLAIINNDKDSRTMPEFDCFLEFPFLIKELRKIIISALDRSEAKSNEESDASEKCFIADRARHGVVFKNSYISLSEYEFKLLELLCQNTNSCISREKINSLFQTDDGNIADVYICHLRNKLEVPFGVKIIYTVRKKGYMTDYMIK